MKKLILLGFIVVSIAFAGVFRAGSISAYSDGNNITVKWGTEDESNVKEFIVERSSDLPSNFTEIQKVAKRGSYSYYEYTDQSAFKTTSGVYLYRIKCIFNDGSYQVSEATKKTYHKVSTVKRTWGSLKAMFR